MQPLKSGERLRMRNWLEQVINNGEFSGVDWVDKRHGKFRVPWKHASRHGWDIEKDASIFKRWAVYTGKYPENCRELSIKDMRKLAKVWKANFRCALNALQDVEVLREEGKSKGTDAYKVFQILPRKSKHGKVRLNSQGCEESSKTGIKIRKRSVTGRHSVKIEEPACDSKRFQNEEFRYFPCIDHNYSDTQNNYTSFNMNKVVKVESEIEDMTCRQLIEELSLNNGQFKFPCNTMYGGPDEKEGVSHYGNGVQYSSSDEFDTSSSGSDTDINPALVAQILASPSCNETSLNLAQCSENAICIPQQAIKREYEASIYQASSILPMGAQPLLNSHFKDGATDPFCGGFNETKEQLNLAW